MSAAEPDRPPQQPGGLRPLGDGFVDDELSWLRDPDLGPEVRSWLRAERSRHDAAARRYRAWEEHLASRAAELVPPTATSPTWTVAGAAFRWCWPPGADHPELVRESGGEQVVVLDVGSLSTTGFARLGDSAVSPDGRRLAYTLDTTGAEVYQLRVRDLTDLAEQVLTERAYYGLAWSADGRFLLSTTHDAADRPHQLWRYEVTGAEDPLLLHEERDQRFHLALRTSGDGRYAVLRAVSRLTSEEWLVDLHDGARSLDAAGGRVEGHDYFVEPFLRGGRRELAVCAEDEHGAHRIRIRARPRGAGQAPDRELLAAAPERRPTAMAVHGEVLVVSGREEGGAALWLLDTTGVRPPLLMRAPAGSTLAPAPYDTPDGEVCITTEGLVEPLRWASVDVVTGRRTPLFPGAHAAATRVPLSVDELAVPARDGVVVPVTVVRREDVPLDGTAPCLLYGYGAWETVIEPDHDPVRIALVEAGVVYAHAHVRGGGERGRDWWRQGRMEHKHRTFDDFLDVASFLADGKVDRSRIVAQGLSAGGLLMGAVYSQAPEAFAGVLAEAPFVDPVTTMSDARAPLVVVERDEWGDPRRDEDRAWMLDWSPYDNPPPLERRPRLLVTSALHDPRVSVWEPARWTARLRSTGSTGNEVLFRVDEHARGHWPPPGRWERIRFRSALLAWVADTMDLPTPGRSSGGGGVQP